MKNFKKQAAIAIASAVPDAGLDAREIEGLLEYPPDPAMGDLAFPCFRLSKVLRQAPPKIAASLAETLADFPL
ncbi:MAG: arginine--tRNA ligase, partial [Clostridia bacterium]|nr:arginine--tRNA ligase [Clostridia bacterium]